MAFFQIVTVLVSVAYDRFLLPFNDAYTSINFKMIHSGSAFIPMIPASFGIVKT